MMQNPHQPNGVHSMMGGLGLVGEHSSNHLLCNFTVAEFRQSVANGAYQRWDLELTLGRNRDDDSIVRSLEAKGPLAIFLTGPDVTPMHWHGSAGAWMHDLFYTHRLARIQRQRSFQPTPAIKLPRPTGTKEGNFLLSVHVRSYQVKEWNLPASYYASAIQSIFDSLVSVTCENSDIVVVGDRTSDVLPELQRRFRRCGGGVLLEARNIHEPMGEPRMDPHARDDYDPQLDERPDPLTEERRNYIYRDLEILGLSDFLILSNSEFSTMAQSLSHPATIILCPPRRPGKWNRGLPCDRVGTPHSLLTNPGRGDLAVPSHRLQRVDGEYLKEWLPIVWERVLEGKKGGNGNGNTPLWDLPNHGIVKFDYGRVIEESWPLVEDLWFTKDEL
eukprot:CAMPEP_0194369566 /NCGR_PEP_ID=MMETSP0174-20130528/17883_1 /TAXON_ID=216777 /ORGANISM="Proboscia alata, Strain PI-D3" /LENGTH=387 /DNA_ID=CAMNT_0039146589 /DNA_START=365 /DNA_END=1528 /DNA_ORIENTATION=+